MPYLISFRAQIVSLVLCISGLNLSAAPKVDLIELYHGVAEGNYLIGDLGGAERGVEQMLRIDPDYLPALTLKARVMLDQIVTFGNSVIEFDKIYFWRSAQVKTANAEN